MEKFIPFFIFYKTPQTGGQEKVFGQIGNTKICIFLLNREENEMDNNKRKKVFGQKLPKKFLIDPLVGRGQNKINIY